MFRITMTDNSLQDLITTILNGIEQRKQQHKTDAYFDLPKEITIDQIKLLQKMIENNQSKVDLKCRLYSRYRLQVYWDGCPRRNTIEYL